jgi:hypothetical protein
MRRPFNNDRAVGRFCWSPYIRIGLSHDYGSKDALKRRERRGDGGEILFHGGTFPLTEAASPLPRLTGASVRDLESRTLFGPRAAIVVEVRFEKRRFKFSMKLLNVSVEPDDIADVRGECHPHGNCHRFAPI